MVTLTSHIGDLGSPYIPVFVPERHLVEVYELLAERAAGHSAKPDESASSEPEVPLGESAGAADKRFRDPAFVQQHLASRSDTVRATAKYLAERPGQWVTSETIATALELEHGWNSLAGALGAAGHYFKRREIGQPWHWTYETPDGRVQLMMDAATAKAILSVV